MVFSHEGERKSEMKTRKAFVLSGRMDCLAQRRRGTEEFLDRINRINRILGNGSNILNLVNPVNPV